MNARRLGLGLGLALGLALAAFGQATVNFAITNSDGTPFNGRLMVYPIGSQRGQAPVLADGSFLVRGVPERCEATNGLASGTFMRGSYFASNEAAAFCFAVPLDSGTFNAASNLIGGYNIFAYVPGVTADEAEAMWWAMWDSNAVSVAGGSGVTVTTNVTAEGTLYTVSGDGGGGGFTNGASVTVSNLTVTGTVTVGGQTLGDLLASWGYLTNNASGVSLSGSFRGAFGETNAWSPQLLSSNSSLTLGGMLTIYRSESSAYVTFNTSLPVYSAAGYSGPIGGSYITPGTLNSNAFDVATLALFGQGAGVASGASLTNLTLAGTVTIPSKAEVSVESFGAMHNARYLTGTILVGSNYVVLTSGAVSPADVGSYIKIRQGGGAGYDIITTITGTTGTGRFTLAKATTNFLANANLYIAANDDTAALQAAVNYCAATNTGGTIVFPGGGYFIGGTISVPVASSWPGYTCEVRFQGPASVQVAATTTTFALPTSAAVFISGAENLTQSVMFASSGVAGPGYGPRVTFDRIAFRASSNPNGILVDGQWYGGLGMTYCTFDTGGYGEYNSACPAPTYQSIAARWPATGNYADMAASAEHCLVAAGFFHGFMFSEHFYCADCSILNCVNGISPTNCNLATFENLDIEGCVNPINATNCGSSFCGLVINGLFLENAVNNGQPQWWNSATIANDPANYLRGHYDGKVPVGFTNNGASNFNFAWADPKQPGGGATNTVNTPTWFSALSGNATLGSLVVSNNASPYNAAAEICYILDLYSPGSGYVTGHHRWRLKNYFDGANDNLFVQGFDGSGTQWTPLSVTLTGIATPSVTTSNLNVAGALTTNVVCGSRTLFITNGLIMGVQ